MLSQRKFSWPSERGGVSKGREGRILWKLHSWFEFLYLFFISVVYQLAQDVSISFMFPLGIFFPLLLTSSHLFMSRRYFLTSSLHNSWQACVLGSRVSWRTKIGFFFLVLDSTQFPHWKTDSITLVQQTEQLERHQFFASVFWVATLFLGVALLLEPPHASSLVSYAIKDMSLNSSFIPMIQLMFWQNWNIWYFCIRFKEKCAQTTLAQQL